MYNFTDLIAQSYLKYTKEKDDNIAVYFFQQYHLVNYEGKFIFTRSQFYEDLIKKLDAFIKGTAHNYHIDRSYYDGDININEAQNFENFRKKRLLDHQMLLDEMGVNFEVKRVNYEESINANELKEAFDYGLELKDPVRIITPSVTIQAEDLVLRKSKLEFIKTEAIRARDANGIEELDSNGLLPNMVSDNVSPNNLNNSQLTYEEVVDKVISKALEIIKPLGGYNIQDKLLDSVDMNRLNDYVASLVKTGRLPVNTLPFPKISISSQFIRKTIHLVYISIRKKHKTEFIKLVHLFEDFKETQPTTTNSKFSTYQGNYDQRLDDITY